MIIFGGVLVLFILVVFGMVIKSSSKPKKNTLDMFREAEALEPIIVAQWVERACQLAIVDRETSPLLHQPVYDCVSDQFDPPCTHRDFDSYPDGDCWRGRDQLASLFSNHAHNESRQRVGVVLRGASGDAVVAGPDFIDILYNSTAEPGGSITRLVRVADDCWHSYSWRAGMSPLAKDIDPPFMTGEVRANPELWLDRERTAHERMRANSNYRYAQTLCKHCA